MDFKACIDRASAGLKYGNTDQNYINFIAQKQSDFYSTTPVQKRVAFIKEFQQELDAMMNDPSMNEIRNQIQRLEKSGWSGKKKAGKIIEAMSKVPMDQRNAKIYKHQDVLDALALKRDFFFGGLKDAEKESDGTTIKESSAAKAFKQFKDVYDRNSKSKAQISQAKNDGLL